MRGKVLKKICNIFLDILIVIFGLILIITIYNDVQVKVLKNSYASFFGYSTFEVQTGSMAPTINVNDLIIVKKDDSPKIKDIITYKKGNAFITHRVIESYKETYVTRGDANNTKDEPIKKEQIVGKVIKIIPNFGAVRKTITNPFVLVTLIVTIFIISRLFSNKPLPIKIKKKQKKEEKPVAVKIEEPQEILEKEEDGLVRATSDEIEEKEEDGLVRATSDEIEEKEEDLKLEDEELEELKQAIENTEIDEDDEEKTIYFRKISVDSNDLNPAPPVLVEEEEEEPPKPIIIDEEVSETEEEEKIKTLRKNHKKFNTVIEKVISIKEDELSEIISILDEPKLKTNEPTIKENFLKIYIDGKYYNHCGNVNVDYNSKNICSKLEKVLNEEATKMIKSYHGNDAMYESKVYKYKALFIVLLNIEHINSLYEDINEKVSTYKKKITKYLNYEEKELNEKIENIVRTQKVYNKMLNDTLNSTDTNTFELIYNQLSTNKNIYGLILSHNINFSKVYSNYIISKTYDEGIVAEDKILVIINILLSRIAKDMLKGNFKNKYLLYLPASLYEKETKLNHILKLLEDEFVKNSVEILVKSSVIVNKKKLFKDIKKLGYEISIVYDNNEVKDKDYTIYTIATYLFVEKKIAKTLNLDLMNPKTVVYENILSKVDIPGGEE